jgi:hypothetical protein
MGKGDTVLIRYNAMVTKVATVLETDDKGTLFFDNNGKFVLTNAYIKRAGIEITVLE